MNKILIFQTGGTGASTTGTPPAPLRPRIKRVNLKDMVFYLEQERETCRSSMLYKAYLKWLIIMVSSMILICLCVISMHY